ncbi:5-methyltetrahydropteroyltriglutamate--homocysteine methyltransferase [Pseudomonas syringae]|nr:5-methyltetrahydropteroyltriglutamate--homocysteine methyltransferase [Pseudomonas syringae]MCF5207170.1 5-methyltetrahydropteroyltriglutamate--homocysteine methyltransferase [Pseudomonas syringae]MCF5212775.1 5-methyltetrahydropteroyltriglutamate--homocysteine methyltransferase [Pseudomonas syringae]MCF5218400.1 5-methyltetrahydropteroyltriglutamate--homocysteine methyltransferase [Pseudomonas syringae]MCF5266634.1 5-methyltetrahydropteroyltriglutamate--homocysteine methyltransferase [Pseud
MSLSHVVSAVDNSPIFYGGRIVALTQHPDYFHIGADRELQHALQAFWKQDQGVTTTGAELRTWLMARYPQQVPHLKRDQRFQPDWASLLASVAEAGEQGRKPALIGPLTLLWLSDVQGDEVDRLDLLEHLLPVYGEIFGRLAARGVEWIQIDEPILALDLPLAWSNAFERVYHILQYSPLKKLIGLYHGDLRPNLGVAALLPVAGLHLDSVTEPELLAPVFDRLPVYKVLSLGECDTHSNWHQESLLEARARFGENLMVADQVAA